MILLNIILLLKDDTGFLAQRKIFGNTF